MWANLFTAHTDATFQREREETEREMHSSQQWRVDAAKCTEGLDGDEPLPSGPLEARLKTTPAPSLAFQLTFTQFLFITSSRLRSFSYLVFWPPILLKLSHLDLPRWSQAVSPLLAYTCPPKDLSLLIILTISLHTWLVSSIFNLGFSRAISYTQHAEANWFKEAGFACWCWWVLLKPNIGGWRAGADG